MKSQKQTSRWKDLTIIVAATLIVDIFSLARAERGQPPPMDEQTQAAFDACLTENNLPKPGSGTRPTAEQREVLHDCLQSKGVTLPPHPRHADSTQASEDNSQ